MGDLEIPCKYIIKEQECPYGIKCRFRHESIVERNFTETEAPRSNNSEKNVEKTKANSPRGKKERPKQKNCRFYLHSHCRYGNKCRFNHPKKISSKISEDSKSTVVASSQVFPVNADSSLDEDPNTTNTYKKHSVPEPEVAVESIPERESASESFLDTRQTERSSKPTRPVLEKNIKPAVFKDQRPRVSETKDLSNERYRKVDDYRSQNPPPLTLESFLTRPPVKRPQKGSHKSKEGGQNIREVSVLLAMLCYYVRLTYTTVSFVNRLS